MGYELEFCLPQKVRTLRTEWTANTVLVQDSSVEMLRRQEEMETNSPSHSDSEETRAAGPRTPFMFL